MGAKLDGISLYTTEGDGKIVYTSNGRVGQDISIIQYLNLPSEKNITIRGLIMTKNKFQKNWSKKFGNARNMIAELQMQKKVFLKDGLT